MDFPFLSQSFLFGDVRQHSFVARAEVVPALIDQEKLREMQQQVHCTAVLIWKDPRFPEVPHGPFFIENKSAGAFERELSCVEWVVAASQSAIP